MRCSGSSRGSACLSWCSYRAAGGGSSRCAARARSSRCPSPCGRRRSLPALADAIARAAANGVAVEARQPGLGAKSPGGAARPRAIVLVAEDNMVNQRVAVKMLERLGCRADVVADGSQAVRRLALVPYDLVLMDCQMPVMDGYEATAAIRRASHARANVPIVAMTAHALQGDRERCLAAGMNDYIPKPVQPVDLRGVIERYT